MFGRAFASQALPVACGALGDFDPDVIQRMAASLGADLAEAHRDSRSILLLDRDPLRWEGDGASGVVWGERLPVRVRGTRSWREAAGGGALGLIVAGDRRAVHASVSGIGPLYWRRDGGAAYFATEIAPLVEGADARLTPDWESWASIIALGYPCGDGTPFLEIKRLNPLALLEQRQAGSSPAATGGELAWSEVEPDGGSDVPERIVEGLGAEIDRLTPGMPILCLLSGGWDSRLLLCLLARRDLDLSAWTTDTDEGHDQGKMAAAVASQLSVPHHLVGSDRLPFDEELRAMAVLVEHQSMLHLSMRRLADSLPAGGAGVAYGLGGDTFVKGLVLTPAVIEAPDGRASVGEVFERFSPPFSVPFEPTAWRSLRSIARASFMAAGERFLDHPSAATLTYYWTRTRRGISQAPVRVFGTRHQIVIPFVCDQAVRAALRAPQSEKRDGALYRRVLASADRTMAELPTTSDRVAPERTHRRERRPGARRAYLPLLLESPLRPWFSAELEDGLGRGRLGGALNSHLGLRRVQAICNLSLWWERHRGALVGLDPSELLGPPPRASRQR